MTPLPHSRSLGVVIYPDGSQAEVWQLAFNLGIRFERLAKPRRLTFAPFYLLVGMLWLCTGCSHLRLNITTTGDKAYCLADFRAQTRSCEYESYRDCMAAIKERGYCHPRSK